MNKKEFLQRFILSPLQDNQAYQRRPVHTESSKQAMPKMTSAAVLIAITEKKNGLNVLLTKRSSHLKHHPGQISFPGGKVEDEDHSLVETALREAFEEIGLKKDNVDIIGQLHNYYTVSGFIVTPIVAFIDENSELALDQNEVSEIFYVPLHHFFDQEKHQELSVCVNMKAHQVHFMPYQHYNIWGATASMLKDLALHLTGSR